MIQGPNSVRLKWMLLVLELLSASHGSKKSQYGVNVEFLFQQQGEVFPMTWISFFQGVAWQRKIHYIKVVQEFDASKGVLPMGIYNMSQEIWELSRLRIISSFIWMLKGTCLAQIPYDLLHTEEKLDGVIHLDRGTVSVFFLFSNYRSTCLL